MNYFFISFNVDTSWLIRSNFFPGYRGVTQSSPKCVRWPVKRFGAAELAKIDWHQKSKRWWWVKHFGAWGVSGREEDPAAGGRFDTLADVSPRGCSCSCWLPLHPTPTIWVSPFFFSFCKLRSTANHHLLRWIRPVFRSRYRHTHTRTRLSFFLFCFSRLLLCYWLVGWRRLRLDSGFCRQITKLS